MAGRIEALGDLYPWLVACDEDGAVRGYAYGCAFRTRPAYRFSVETTVYVADGAHRRGIGALLYRGLLALLEAQGFTQAIGAITIPNEASISLHKSLGFARAGTYEKVGFKLGDWRSVGLWQRRACPHGRAARRAEAALGGLEGLAASADWAFLGSQKACFDQLEFSAPGVGLAGAGSAAFASGAVRILGGICLRGCLFDAVGGVRVFRLVRCR